MTSPLRVFVDGLDAAMTARVRAEVTRAGWVVVDDAAAADVVLRASAASRGNTPGVEPAWDDDGQAPIETLTPRELDVLRLLADGAGNRAIGERLGISDHTVKFHLSAIFGKLGVVTRTAAVRRALRLGWIDA